MALQYAGEKTLVFNHISGCTCNTHLKGIKNVVTRNGTNVKVKFDENDGGKLIVTGRNLDPNTIIAELENEQKTRYKLAVEESFDVQQTVVSRNNTTAVMVHKQIPPHNRLQNIAPPSVQQNVASRNKPTAPVVHKQIPRRNRLQNNASPSVQQKPTAVVVHKQIPPHDGLQSIAPPSVQPTVVSHNKTTAVVVHKQLPPHNRLPHIAPRNITPRSHKHKFELEDYNKRFTCDGCKEDGFLKGYKCKYCSYELHEDCMHQKSTISHDLFGELIFTFSPNKPTCDTLCRVHTKNCEACGNEIHGYSYHCVSKGLYLHPMCVNFRIKECIEGHTFKLEMKSKFQCFWCQEDEKESWLASVFSKEKQTNTGWVYVCKSIKAQLHVKCVAKIAHRAWQEQDGMGDNDAYLMVLKRLNFDLVKKNKGNKGIKLVEMIFILAKMLISILLGDPTTVLASMALEVIRG